MEDDSMVRGWLRFALQGTGFRLVGEAATAAEALDVLRRRGGDVVLVDYRLPDASGTDLVRDLRDGECDIPAVVMTANPQEGLNEAARRAGAQGTTLKTGAVDELVAALDAAVSGRPWYDARHPRRNRRLALTPRERDVLRLVGAGATNAQVAECLGVRPETVKTILSRVYAKLGAHRRANAVAKAHRLGLL